MIKKIIKIILTTCLISCLVFSNTADAFQVSGFEITANTVMLVSLDTGDILFEKNADQKVYPASLTKMLVAVVMLENTVDFDNTVIEMTDSAMNNILGTGSSVIGLEVGEQITARQAFNLLLISSAGDVAYAIADHYGGSVSGFVKMMNEKAEQIGMTSSHFGNPVGLHDEDTYTTGRDIYTLAKYALQYDMFVETTNTVKYTLPPTNKCKQSRTRSTTNYLINPTTDCYYKYAKGVKTGFTDEAGRCVVSTASYNGYNYLCVIMGCANKDGRRHEFLEAADLFRWAFNNIEYKKVLDASTPICELPVDLSSTNDFVTLYPQEEFYSLLPAKADASTIHYETHLTQDRVEAPVVAGTVYGTADVIYANEKIGTINLIATQDISPQPFLIFAKWFKAVVFSAAFKVVMIVIALTVLIYIILIIRLNKKKLHRKVKYIPLKDEEKKDR